MGTTWNLQQTIAANNGAVAATTVAGTFALTQFNSFLFAVVMVGVAGATITPPAGWKQIGSLQSSNPAGGTLGLFIYQGNPGGITTVTFTITSALASVILQEWIGNYPLDTPSLVDAIAIIKNANGTAWGVTGFLPAGYGEVCICGVGYINPAALTVIAYPQGFTENGNTINGAAAGNAGLRIASLPSNSTINLGITGLALSAAPANGPISFAISIFLIPDYQTNNMVGPASQSIGGVI